MSLLRAPRRATNLSSLLLAVGLGIALALLSAGAWAQSEGGQGDKRARVGADEAPAGEHPAEALEKGGGGDKGARPSSILNLGIGGGASLFRVTQPEDDLYEPVPEATRQEFEQRGYAVVTEGKIDMIVDQQGQIYTDRNYHGIVPGLRNELFPGDLKKNQNKDLILWAGFQPLAAVSRVFWLLTDPAPRFEVTKLDDRQIEVFFPGADITHRNTTREMFTAFFTGPVQTIIGSRARGGIRYIIKLKREANYLYRFESPFLFVDFESESL